MTERMIPLTQGQFAIVDAEDYERVAALNWHAHRHPSYKGEKFTAQRNTSRPLWKSGYPRTIFMHHFVLGMSNDTLIDHINRNPLDNRKENLRICTKRQNGQNREASSNNKCGFKGVCIDHRRLTGKRFRSTIVVEGKQHSLGVFTTPEEAARAYDIAASKYFKEFAYLNFPNG